MREFVIETSNLTKVYGEQTVVNAVNLHVEKGKIYGLLGRNGAGKTTIMKMILGLTSITSGDIKIFGGKLKENEMAFYPKIGAIIENPGFYPNLTGTENLEIFARLRKLKEKDAVKNALDIVGLPYKDKKTFSQYSLGMKQRLGIANAIMHNPDILILDEPTNGLDPIGIAEVRTFFKRLSRDCNKTILVSSHILPEISLLADQVGIIHKGELLEEGSMEELEKKSSSYTALQVSDTLKTIYILENQLNVHNYVIRSDNAIHIYDIELDMPKLNKLLIDNNIGIVSSGICNKTLEDYFREITGGEGIA